MSTLCWDSQWIESSDIPNRAELHAAGLMGPVALRVVAQRFYAGGPWHLLYETGYSAGPFDSLSDAKRFVANPDLEEFRAKRRDK